MGEGCALTMEAAPVLAMIALFGYLLGSLNFSIILSRLRGDDVRSHGSGNAGMTNMLRTYGKLPAAMTFIGDFLKGTLAVVLGRMVAGAALAVYGGLFGALGALLGHMFPLYFGFKGGKGVATGLGLLAALDPASFLIVAVIFIPIAPITGYVSLASVLGAGSFAFVLLGRRWLQGAVDPVEMAMAFLLGAIIVFNHRKNIKRLLNGTERKFSRKKPGT